ncbi:hypothetical protein [Gordonia sp. SMJS1]|uniref:hypothetical protein n=1 Tax=Gordonia sp. SMJS1 TaxID=3039400 RepID=UPI0024582A4D|nr:hypothetical protein [Gordonia sp. SMJS1]WGJ88204.1 hypothetical protein QAD21_24780 [Gordonia sp. SMJS1]
MNLATIAAERLGVALSKQQAGDLTRHLLDGSRAFTELEGAVRTGTISHQTAAVAAVTLWPAKPDNVTIDYPLWRDLFRIAGFSSDGAATPRPRSSLLLFRGATPDRARGLSWTTDLEQAHYFATQRQVPGATACTWAAWVTPSRMLAFYGHTPPCEFEVVVDATDFPVLALSNSRLEQLMAAHGGRYTRDRRSPLHWAYLRRQLRRELLAMQRATASASPPAVEDL